METINKHELRNELNNLTILVKLAYLKKDKSILNSHKFGYLFSDLNVTDFTHKGNQNFGKKSRGVRLVMNSQIYHCDFYKSQNTEIISFRVNFKKFISKDRRLKYGNYGNVILN